VRALLRRASQSESTIVSYHDVQADMASQRATRGGHPLDLTAKEFSLLVLFLRRPGNVFSRARIYESVWGDEYDGLSNTLEVHVKELRRKLEQHGGRIIQTRRGRGYVLEATSEESTGQGFEDAP
jgi:DNA-binding response OmpR family regulator